MIRLNDRLERALARTLEDRGGIALIATILVIALVAALTAAALNSAMSAVRTSSADYRDTRSFYASEAGGEYALAQVKIALQDGFLSDDEIATFHPPEIAGFDFDSFTVEKLGEPVVETITDGPFAGLYSLTQNIEVYARAVDAAGNASAVLLNAKAQAIPIFQFGVFFEEDLEATNGPPMEFVGRVHSNGNVYLSSRNAWYREVVTTPRQVYHNRKDHHLVYDGVYINDAEGNEVPLDFDSRSHPDPEAFKAESCAKFDCRLQTDAFEVHPLSLPLPDDVPPYELMRPREEDDGDAERQVKYAWNSDMYVTVNLTDIRTRNAVCGGAATPPDEADGEIVIQALDPIYEGAGWVWLRASHPSLSCEEFDWRAELQIDADEWEHEGTMDGCTFQAYIPGDSDEIEIEIEIEADDYAQLEDDIEGKAKWHLDEEEEGGEESTPWPNITVERLNGLTVPADDDKCNIFQWDWSAFYDGREEELKDVLDIDINALSVWVGGDTTRTSEVIYVEFVVPQDLSGYSEKTFDEIYDATLDPAIRMINGRTLPNRLTVAAEWPVYTLGDYNSLYKKPASLAGDGITILSNDWEDRKNTVDDPDHCQGQVWQGHPCGEFEQLVQDWEYHNSSETTVNAAVLAGHWPTPCDHYEPDCEGGYADFYGGGIENFPRFLERWRDGSDKVTFHYTGALISPFTSQKTTGTWNGYYYVPPQRDWWFDIDFRNPELLPPATPNVGNILRTGMREAL